MFLPEKKLPPGEESFQMPGERYQYLRILGHGAYGLVCAAMDRKTDEMVAVKRINQINSLLVARRTLRELKLLGHFRNHPNIIGVFDVFKSDAAQLDELYISQELMDADLYNLIQSKHVFADEHCQKFLYQILRGLKAIHSSNVLHRDLKPGNLLWKHSGELKICDFGLARGIEEPAPGSRDLVLTNYVATRWYRPPEILLSKKQYGKAVDMWSVGCIFAELLGRKVFLPGKSELDQLHLIVQKLGTPDEDSIVRVPSERSQSYLRRLPRYEAAPLGRRFPDASPLAVDLLARMLTFEPSRRITVEQALAHPYLQRYHDPSKEPIFPSFDFEFDHQCVTLIDIKNCILEEVKKYAQPKMPMPLENIARLSIHSPSIIPQKSDEAASVHAEVIPMAEPNVSTVSSTIRNLAHVYSQPFSSTNEQHTA